MDRGAGRWIRIIFLCMAAGAVLFFLFSIGGLVKLLIISALLAYIMDPVAVFLESRGVGRVLATVIIFLSVALVIAVTVLLLLPVFIGELNSIQTALRSGQANAFVQRFEESLSERLAFLGIRNLDIAERIQSLMTGLGTWILGHLLGMVSVLTDLVLIPIFVFFLLKDGRGIKKRLISLAPNRYFEFSLNLLYKMDLQLGNYLRGQFIDAMVFGILSVCALWLLGVKYFLIVGMFAGFANLIPFLGPVVGATVAVTISVIDTGGFVQASYIVLAFVLMKVIDDSIVQPLAVAKSVHMHPLTVLLAVIMGGKFFGILGMLLSVPVTGFIKVVLDESISNFRRYHLT